MFCTKTDTIKLNILLNKQLNIAAWIKETWMIKNIFLDSD